MQDELTLLIDQAKTSIVNAEDMSAIEQLRVQYLGKKGQLTQMLKGLGKASPAERPKLGQAINTAKQELQTLFAQHEAALQEQAMAKQLAAEQIDVTLAGRGQQLGSMHPVSKVRERFAEIFMGMGFTIEEGPEIEDDHHNFEMLNFPPNHPARAAQDTFYFPDGRLLRTHTSPVQIRTMQRQKPPLRIITPGRVYRCDSDQTHTPMFHQVEGLVVDRHCTLANLKWLLQEFFNQFFETEVTMRFRPSFFPFTEPSAEVDIQYLDRDEWLEVLGCGMVHPNVLRNVGIDPDEFTGFAFGLGLDRLAMLRYGINDLRTMFENDLRFLKQF